MKTKTVRSGHTSRRTTALAAVAVAVLTSTMGMTAASAETTANTDEVVEASATVEQVATEQRDASGEDASVEVHAPTADEPSAGDDAAVADPAPDAEEAPVADEPAVEDDVVDAVQLPVVTEATVTADAPAGEVAAQTGPDSEEVAAAAPSAPSPVTAVVSGDDVEITWSTAVDDGVNPVARYSVSYYDVDSGAGLGRDVDADVRSDTFTDIPVGRYAARVYAVNSVGDDGEEAAALFDILAVAPGAPEDVAAVQGTPGDITVTWTAPTDPGTSAVDHYDVTLDADPSTLVTVPADEALTAGFQDLAPGTYNAQVTATNVDGLTGDPAVSGPITVAAVATPEPDPEPDPEPEGTVPSVPQNVTVTQTGPRQVTVRFDAAADPGSSPITGYSIGAIGSTSGGGQLYPEPTRSMAFDDIDPDTYLFSVRAFNDAGGSAFVDITITVRADWTPPAVVVPVVTAAPTAAAPTIDARTTPTPSSTSANTLANTGTEASSIALSALALIGLGAATITTSRRRPRPGHPG